MKSIKPFCNKFTPASLLGFRIEKILSGNMFDFCEDSISRYIKYLFSNHILRTCSLLLCNCKQEGVDFCRYLKGQKQERLFLIRYQQN
jgi:hypothetical protein